MNPNSKEVKGAEIEATKVFNPQDIENLREYFNFLSDFLSNEKVADILRNISNKAKGSKKILKSIEEDPIVSSILKSMDEKGEDEYLEDNSFSVNAFVTKPSDRELLESIHNIEDEEERKELLETVDKISIIELILQCRKVIRISDYLELAQGAKIANQKTLFSKLSAITDYYSEQKTD